MIIIGENQIRCPPRILGNENTGWMTGIGGVFYNTYNLAKWGIDGVITTIPLQPLSFAVGVDDGFQANVGNRYILGGRYSGGPSINIGEYNINTGQLLFEKQLGDSTCRWGGAAKAQDGGIGAFVYADPTPKNYIDIDAFYRLPFVPTMSIPAWWYKRFRFPSDTGNGPDDPHGVLPFQTTVVWWKGFFYLFWTRDTAGRVGLARFKVNANGDGLEVDYENAGFINNGDAAACSGEYPLITAVVDIYHNRIILGYQSYHLYPNNTDPIMNSCAGGPWAAHWALTEVKSDLTYKSLGTTKWWINHNTQTRPIIFPKFNEIYYAFAYTNIETNCETGWNLGVFKNNEFYIARTLGEGNILAFSEDEWIIFYDKLLNKSLLIKLKYNLILKIRKFNQSLVIIEWTQSRPDDVLEQSIDLGAHWSTVYTGNSPVVLAMDKNYAIFRIKKNY